MFTTDKTSERTHTDDGFTLIEMMVVIMIIGLMASLIIPNLLGNKTKADQKKTVADIVAIENALTMYNLENGMLPDERMGLRALINEPESEQSGKNRTGNYLRRLPDDPWHHPYHYDMPGKHDSYDVYSLGADNKPGGEGVNQDIGTWNVNDI